MVATFVVKPEAFMQSIISFSRQMAACVKRNSNFILRPSRLRFRPMGVYFGACRGDSARESSEKCQVIAPCVVGFDLLDHKRTEHAFGSRVRVRGQYQRKHPDDCPRTGALVCHFPMAPDRV